MSQEQIDRELDDKIEAVLLRDASRMPAFPTVPPASMLAMLGSVGAGLWSSLTSKVLFFAAGAATVGGLWYFTSSKEPAHIDRPSSTTTTSQPQLPASQDPAGNSVEVPEPGVAATNADAQEGRRTSKAETTRTTPTAKRPALDLKDDDDPNAPHFPLKGKQ